MQGAWRVGAVIAPAKKKRTLAVRGIHRSWTLPVDPETSSSNFLSLFPLPRHPPPTPTPKKPQEWSASCHAVEEPQLPFRAAMDLDGNQAPSASPSAPSPSSARTSYELRLERDASAAVASDPLAASDPARLALLLSKAGHDAFVRRALGSAGKRRTQIAASVVGGGSGGGNNNNNNNNNNGVGVGAVAVPLHSRAIFETLAHSFVIVRPPTDSSGPSNDGLLVVDAGFRDAVAVVSPPPALARVLAGLPRVFVGRAAALDEAVRRVAQETRLALEAEGRPLPPWRSAKALLSKWMPQGAGAVVDERPSSFDDDGSSCCCSSSSSADAGAGLLSPPTSPASAAGCCSPFSSSEDGRGGRSVSSSPEGPLAASPSASGAVPPTALGGKTSSSSPPIALVAPPLVARLSVSLLSSSLARASASASTAAETAARAAKAAVDEMRPVRRATWAPAA